MSDGQRRDFPDSAIMFLNKRKTGNQPDFRGDLEVSRALLKAMIDLAKAGQPIKISVAAWSKTTRNGDPMLSVKLSPPFVREQPQGMPAQAPAPAPEPTRAPPPVMPSKGDFDL